MSGPLTVGEVVAALQFAGVTTSSWTVKPPHRVVGDMLAYQVRAGRVCRTERATNQIIPTSLSRSTQRRCRQWRDLLADY